MRLAIGVLVIVFLGGCSLSSGSYSAEKRQALGSLLRSQALDRRFDAMERQMQTDRWAAEDRHFNAIIQGQSRLGNIPY